MTILTFDDAMEAMERMTPAVIRWMIRTKADMQWIRECCFPDAEAEITNFGVWASVGRDFWPMLLIHVERPASPLMAGNKGVAVITFIKGESDDPFVSCTTSVSLSAIRYIGDANGRPGVLNGDVPWLCGCLSGESTDQAVEAGLASLRSPSATSEAPTFACAV